MITVNLEQYDFSGPLALSGLRWEVESLSWQAVGGPSTARLRVQSGGRGRSANLQALSELLRCGLRVSEDGLPAWWGYVSAVELHIDGRVMRFSLDEMWNRAAVNYQVSGPQAWLNLRAMTAFGENAASVARYGAKEKLYGGGAMSLEQAMAYRAAALARSAQPARSVANRKSDGRRTQLDYAMVEGRGWWQTTHWRYYSDPRGQETDTRAAVELAWGDDPTRAKLAQGVQTAETWSTNEIWMQVGSRGAADNLVLSVYSNAGGYPGALVLGAANLAGSSLAWGLEWVSFRFDSPLTLTGGVTYWMVLSRSGGSNPGAFYLAGMDGQMHYGSGSLLVWDGVTWVAALADLTFQVLGREETTTHMARMLGASFGGQFLSGVRVEQASGVYWPMWRAGKRRSGEEIEAALALGDSAGTRLLASVDEQRVARIYAQPAADTAGLLISADGRLRGLDGEPLRLHQAPAGQWARPLGIGAPTWIEAATWNGKQFVMGEAA